MKKVLFLMTVSMFSVVYVNTIHAQDVASKLNMLEIVISNLVSRVDALEKRVGELEKGKNISPGISGVSRAPKKETTKPPVTNGFVDIGNGFFARNVRFNPFGDNVMFTGEIANRTDRNFRFAKFVIEIYDGDLVAKKEEFTIPDIPKDSIQRFEAMIIGFDAGSINRYVIRSVE